MRVCIVTGSVLGAVALGSFSGLAAEPRTTPVDASVCSLITHPTTYDGKEVRVSGALDYGIEWTRLFSAKCPDADIFVKPRSPNLDLSGCSPANVGKKYGCPTNFSTGLRVKLQGKFHYQNKTCILAVESISYSER